MKALFKRYAAGTTTAVQLAAWMNKNGFRTLNRHRFGKDEAEGRYFTNASIRGILHNPFYTGRVRHKDELLDGVHEPLVSWEIFQQVQANMKRNSGRSRTLATRPQREYLLKGLIRCVHCGMPLWAQTFASGRSYYREHRGSRGAGGCKDIERSIPCAVVDEQVGTIIETMVLPDDWLDRALERISMRDEVARVTAERQRLTEKLRRLTMAWIDGYVDEADYQRHKRQTEFDLAALVVPEADAVAEAGRLLQRLPGLWALANLTERRRLLATILDAVFVDVRGAEATVAIQPKAAFEAVMAGNSILVSVVP